MEFLWRTYEKNRRVWQMEPAARRAKITGKWQRYNDLLRRRFADPLRFRALSQRSEPTAPPLDCDLLERTRRYFTALAAYFPAPLAVQAVCYSADHSGRHLRHIAPGLEIVEVATDHFGCVTTHLHVVAADLRKRLDGAVPDTDAATGQLGARDSDDGQSDSLARPGIGYGEADVYVRARV